ncbi:hypothetical protein JCM3770_006400 [Rhodotorula araucariae]
MPFDLLSSSESSSTPRRPSRRVSELVSRFESTVATPVPPASAAADPAEPSRPAAAAASGGRVRQQVKRFSTGAATVGTPVVATGACPSAPPPAVVPGDFVALDRSSQTARSPVVLARALPGATARRSAAPAFGKARAAPTVVIPATVSPAATGAPRLTVERAGPALPRRAPPCPAEDTERDKELDGGSEAVVKQVDQALKFTTASGRSASTRCVLAYELFARDAAPLVLPDLDHALNALGGAARFSPMPGPRDRAHQHRCADEKGEEWELKSLEERAETDDGTFGSELERKGWEKWVRGAPPSRWYRFLASLRRLVLRRSFHAAGLSRDEYLRTLKFPPFHLLPANLTVTDLKANRRRPPPLISLQGMLLAVSNGLLGAAGSSMGISLTTVEGLRDLMQMVTLLLTAASPALSTLIFGSTLDKQLVAQSSTLRLLFVTVPSFLSLDFVSAFGQALAFLLVLTVATLVALYEFFRFTGGWRGPARASGRGGQLDLGEGFDREDLQERPHRRWRDSYAWRVAVTFWCGSLYLPLSKLAIGALVWSDDFWVVTNPYELYRTDDPVPPALGDAKEFYPSMDFCWRTTMRRRAGTHHLNFAFALVPVSVAVLAALALWFPWRMWSVVQREAPRVDAWTELGERRRDTDAEYEWLLDVDPSPFNFLYRDYRKRWAAFRSIYLAFKLVNVLLVVLIQKNNCVFRSYGQTYLSVVRQGSLLSFAALFCLASALSSPYLTRISNSSDIVSRVGYVFLALLGLLAALSLPGTDPAVITTNVVVYGLNIYFTTIGLGTSQRIVKKLQRRLDWSIDIFSPQLDLAKHLSRRVWQESLAALLLCSPDFAMQSTQKLQFSQEQGLPPYLLNFKGSPAERFVENLKILREIGLDAYCDAMRYRNLSPDTRVPRIRRLVQLQYTGPDMYYRPANLLLPVTSYFGRVDVVPFPFVVVFRYDQQPAQPLHLVEVEDLERLVDQNRSTEAAAARKVRLALRALEGQLVFAPHVEIHQLGRSGGAEVERHVAFRMATLRIKRNSTFLRRGYNYSSGFEVALEYADGEGPDRNGRMRHGQKLVLDGADIGVFDDFQLTPPLATLFRRNRTLVEQRVSPVERALLQHADFFRHEADLKHRVLSHSFLLNAFAQDGLSARQLECVLGESEHDPKVLRLVRTHKASITRLEERMDAVTGDAVRGWWYLFFDDLWRRNHDIGLQEDAFSPHYSLSVCYHPMSRADLEAFLHSQGFSTGRTGFFHTGFLNRLYFHLDERVFVSTPHAIPIHLGASPSRLALSALPSMLAHAHVHRPVPVPDEHCTFSHGTTAKSHFTTTTGGGTSEDDTSIRHRGAFLFEEVYERPAPRFYPGARILWMRFQLKVRAGGWAKRFLGLEPVVRDWRPGEDEGVVLDLRKGKAGWEAPRWTREGTEVVAEL